MNKIELTDIESQVIDFLNQNEEGRLKEFFLAELSWITQTDKKTQELMSLNGYAKNRAEVVVEFFTNGHGKRMLDILPKQIKEFISVNFNE